MLKPPGARLAGVVVGLALAYAAQALFNRSDLTLATWQVLPTFYLAALALVAGGLLFAVAAPPPVAVAPPVPTAVQGSTLLLAASLIVYSVGLAAYLFLGETSLGRGLWALSIAVLGLSQVRWSGWRVALSRRWSARGPLVLPALILLVALALRVYRLADLPQDVHGDMASHGLQARAMLQGSVGGLVGVGWAGIPLLGFVPTVAAMALTGDQGLLGLRLASAIGGVLSVWGLYVLLNEQWGRRVALLGAALLTAAAVHLHFSRIAEYMDPVPFGVWSLALLTVGLRSRRGLLFVASGATLALSGLMYYSGRVLWVIVPLYLVYLWATDRPVLAANRSGLALLGLGLLFTLGPYLPYWLTHTDLLLERSREVFLFNPPVLEHLQHKYNVTDTWSVLLEQVRRSLLLFNYYPDSSTQFGFSRPMVDPWTAPLVVVGTAWSLAHVRHRACALLALWLGCVLVAGSVLTNNAPFWPRLVIILLPAAGLAGLAIDRAWQAVEDALGCEWNRLVAMIVVGALIAVGVDNGVAYFEFAAHNGRPRALVGRVIAALPTTIPVCLVSEDRDDPWTWIHSFDEREIALFVSSRPHYDVVGDEQPSEECTQPGAVWIVPVSRREVLTPLEETYGGGHVQAHGPRRGEVVFYTYQVPAPARPESG